MFEFVSFRTHTGKESLAAEKQRHSRKPNLRTKSQNVSHGLGEEAVAQPGGEGPNASVPFSLVKSV